MKLEVTPDKDTGSVTVEDTGIGMTREDPLVLFFVSSEMARVRCQKGDDPALGHYCKVWDQSIHGGRFGLIGVNMHGPIDEVSSSSKTRLCRLEQTCQ